MYKFPFVADALQPVVGIRVGYLGKDSQAFAEQGEGTDLKDTGLVSPSPPPLVKLGCALLWSLMSRYRLKRWLSLCLNLYVHRTR